MWKWLKMFCQGWWRRITRKSNPEAEKRLKICMECDDKIELAPGEYICGHCGCFLKAAVLADDKKCSLGKW